MKPLKLLFHNDKSKNEPNLIKTKAGKLIKSIIVIFMLSSITMLSSCMFPGPGHGNRGGPPGERHGNNERHGGGEHHDNDDHHNN